MAAKEIATAMRRAEAVLQRRPEIGLHDDAPATASWENGTRVVARHANGTQLATDMPRELGGSGDIHGDDVPTEVGERVILAHFDAVRR